MSFERALFEEPSDGPYTPEGPKKRGRKPGSKNKPKPDPGSAAELLHRSARAEPHEERFVGEAEPKEIDHNASEPKREAESIAIDPEFERMLGEVADFSRFGTSARSPMFIVQDVSLSEAAHEKDWLAGAPEVASELSKNVVARNLADVVHITGAESAQVVGFAHGAFDFPQKIRYGRGTCCRPWMVKVCEAYATYTEHLKAKRIATREGLVVFASDFQFSDFDAGVVSLFRAHCKRNRLVVVSAMFGDSNPSVARQFSYPIPPVDLKQIPLGLFIRELTKSVTQSVSRQASLESLMANAITGLLERSTS